MSTERNHGIGNEMKEHTSGAKALSAGAMVDAGDKSQAYSVQGQAEVVNADPSTSLRSAQNDTYCWLALKCEYFG